MKIKTGRFALSSHFPVTRGCTIDGGLHSNQPQFYDKHEGHNNDLQFFFCKGCHNLLFLFAVVLVCTQVCGFMHVALKRYFVEFYIRQNNNQGSQISFRS